MATTTISTKGQVVIPKDVRIRHGWDPGTPIEVEEIADGVLLRRARKLPQTSIDDLLGCLPYDGPAKTLEEMEEAIARGAREQE